MRKCPRCEREGVHPAGGRYRKSYYCDRHRRFFQMRAKAQYDGKTIPGLIELESLVPEDMQCQACNRAMNWFMKQGGSTTITL